MKKYKVHFSFFNLFSESQSEVVKLQQLFKTISAAVVGTVWYESNATYALYVAIGGALVDVFLSCFYFEPIEAKKPEADAEQV